MALSSRTKAYGKLIVVSILIGLLCAILGDSLKRLTAYYEGILFAFAVKHWVLYLLFPVTGLTIIHWMRYTLFNKKENKGIKEIFETVKSRHNELPFYKIPSHYITGFLTVIFGGSTGIEVSTVVAAATIGHVTQKQAKVHTAFRKELIWAGVAAAITALFNSPVAGILFALEVVSKKISRNAVISIVIAALTVAAFNYIFQEKPLFALMSQQWHYQAIPFFIVLGFISGIHAVYFTKTVLFFKDLAATFKKYTPKILVAATILSSTLLFFPQLYGDGYEAMKELFTTYAQGAGFSYSFIFFLLAILLLKPIVTSVTLAAGGDGGVFAPGLFTGAFLGLLTALIINKCFHTHVVPLNFMVIGMAAVLSACLHAPLTAVFLVCALVGNYVLLLPLLLACFIAKYTAQWIYPYTVYTYLPVKNNKEIIA